MEPTQQTNPTTKDEVGGVIFGFASAECVGQTGYFIGIAIIFSFFKTLLCGIKIYDIQLYAGTHGCILYTQQNNLIKVWMTHRRCLTSSALPLGLKSPTARGPQPALTVCTEN